MTSPHDKYVQQLSQEDRMLVLLRDDLYDGSWDKMMDDLKDRLQGKPYIFKLVNRIQDDLTRIEKLRAYEKKHRINLSDHIQR